MDLFLTLLHRQNRNLSLETQSVVTSPAVCTQTPKTTSLVTPQRVQCRLLWELWSLVCIYICIYTRVYMSVYLLQADSRCDIRNTFNKNSWFCSCFYVCKQVETVSDEPCELRSAWWSTNMMLSMFPRKQNLDDHSDWWNIFFYIHRHNLMWS